MGDGLREAIRVRCSIPCVPSWKCANMIFVSLKTNSLFSSAELDAEHAGCNITALHRRGLKLFRSLLCKKTKALSCIHKKGNLCGEVCNPA